MSESGVCAREEREIARERTRERESESERENNRKRERTRERERKKEKEKERERERKRERESARARERARKSTHEKRDIESKRALRYLSFYLLRKSRKFPEGFVKRELRYRFLCLCLSFCLSRKR